MDLVVRMTATLVQQATTMTDAATSVSVVVQYDLHPPSSVTHPPTLKPSETRHFPLQQSSVEDADVQPSDYSTYYDALKDAVKEAQVKIGEELTHWRDAVQAEEKDKEPKKRSDDDEEEEEEDIDES